MRAILELAGQMQAPMLRKIIHYFNELVWD
jgi:hypothetical protein